MKEYLGNYLGLCINNDDPERRGRVQIFIPHIMPALFKDWNEAGEDIQMLCVGDNLPQSLPSYIVEKLKKMLPWAECASPILGTSSPGQLVGNNFDQSPITGGGVASQTSVTPNIPDGGTPFGTYSEGDIGPGGLHFHIDTGNARGGGFFDRALLDQYVQVNGKPLSSGATVNGGEFGASRPGGDHTAWDYAFGGGKLTLLNGAKWIRVDSGTGVGDIATFQIPSGQTFRILHGKFTPNQGGLDTAGVANAPKSALLSDPASFTSLGGSSASSNPHQTPNPFDLNGNPTFANPEITAQGNAASIASGQAPTLGGDASSSAVSNADNQGGGLLVDQRGRVNAAQLKAELLRQIQSNPSSIYNNGKVPLNGQKYGLDGTPQSWANFYGKLAGFESGYYANSPFKYSVLPGTKEPGGSGGLFQLGSDQIEIWANTYPQLAQKYGFQAGVNYPPQLYLDPNFSTKGMLFIGEALLSENFAVGPGQGLGRTIGLSWGKIASGRDPGTGAIDPSIRPDVANAMIMTTDPGGATSTLNINDMAKGVFTYPAAGALLWVFFREGNPLFPVYFAANYGQREWQSAFRQGSDAPGYKPAPTEGNPIVSTGTVINWGVGGIRVENTTDPSNPANNQRSVMLFGHDGSNMFMNNGYHQIYSKFNRRDQVDGSRFQSTLGTKEELVQSDSNSIVMGDRIIKIGNVTPDAIQAMDRIHDIIKEIMKPLSESNLPPIKQFPKLPEDPKGKKYVQDAINLSKTQYKVPEPAPYKIPAQEVLRSYGFEQPEMPVPPIQELPPEVAGIEQIPITPPTPPA